ncbi:hypothetical protein FGG79_03500 [Bacillus sp. BHET2]|uniref:hypothetical protein n=1 Tax=Bacillus sp. BHET2 TaxID=2583818 RepID=UPI00110EF75B|nr:hypothetical protein [Bacillus sp. BHET2]TMU87212.1 hypothetical protein FGG79_03500 [Bacillus sp. BHET2]
MSITKIMKEAKLTILICLLASVALFITWAIFETMDISLINNKALLALSLIPFSAAIASFLKLMKIKKDPNIMISEMDERLVSQKNEADAKTLKMLQGLLFLTYLGYTFMVPEDVFHSIGWWTALSIFLFSLFAPFMFRHIVKES